MSRTAVTVRWMVGFAGVLTLAILLVLNPPATTRYFVLFTLAMVASELLLTARIGPGSYFSVSSAFLFVFFLLSGSLAAAVLDGTSKALVWLAQTLLKRRPPTGLFAFYSIGQGILACLAAGFAVTMISPRTDLADPISVRPLTSLAVFAVAYLLFNAAVGSLAAIARGWTEIRNVVIPRTGFWSAASLLTSVPFAVIMALIALNIGYPAATALVFLMLAGISAVIKLNVRLREGNEELKAINRIGTMLTATLDLSQLFRILARESRRVLQWDGFFIAIADKGSTDVQLIFMTSSGDEITQRTIARGKGLTGRALETGEIIFYERGEGETLDDEDTVRGQKKARSIVVAPMKFNEEIIGAISLQSFDTDVYGRSQMRLLQTIASQAAGAVRNAQLYRSEQMAKNERDEFLSLVTHEIKNPLTSIRGYADIAESSFMAGDQPGAVDALHVVRDEAKRILRLAEDLLDASRAAAGKFSVRFEPVDLSRIVEKIVAKYQATSQRTIELEIDPAAPKIEGDPVRLSQVVENLVSNALKYSPSETAVSVAVRGMVDQAVRLLVRDQGPGISAEKLPLIFERFYRIEEQGTVVKGTGLGLFITREIVRMHHGTVEVESAVEKGTTFIVQLPARQPQARK